MCNRYVSPAAADIERQWLIGARNPWRGGEIYPRSPGAFIRASREPEVGLELVVGQWGLIPWFAKTPKLPYQTNNARSEELANKASYKHPWARGQRCIIPAVTFDEPNWETGKNIWYRFGRADGQLWGLAGIWATWTDKATGEMLESYSMLTINADAHPLMSRMHKPDPKLPADQQDKRSVIPVADGDMQAWLQGSVEDAQRLLALSPMDVFDARPMS